MLVIGPGALGVIVAVRLKNAGHRVDAAARNAASAKALPEVWEAIDPQGNVQKAAIPMVTSPARAGPYDALVLATKCEDAEKALQKWLPCLAADGVVIALQNGIIGDELARIAMDRLECTVALPATLLAPGRSEQTADGTFIIGPWPDGRMEAATPAELAGRLMVDVVPTQIHRNMLGVKWTKLCLNSAITGLGVLTGQNLGQLLDNRLARTALVHVVSEGHEAGLAHDVAFERVAGFTPRLVAVKRPNKLSIAKSHLILRVMGAKFRRQRSSSLQSLERGRRTEIPQLNGFIVAAAREADLDVPVNAAIVRIVEEIEAGDRQPDPAWLLELPLRFH